jgi:hypothetical protein
MEIQGGEERNTPEQDWRELRHEYYNLLDSQTYIALDRLHKDHTKYRQARKLPQEEGPYVNVTCPTGERALSVGREEGSINRMMDLLFGGSCREQDTTAVSLIWRFDMSKIVSLHEGTTQEAYKEIRVGAQPNDMIQVSFISKAIDDSNVVCEASQELPGSDWKRRHRYPVYEAVQALYNQFGLPAAT